MSSAIAHTANVALSGMRSASGAADSAHLPYSAASQLLIDGSAARARYAEATRVERLCAMRLALRHSFAAAQRSAPPRLAPRTRLPTEIAFLASWVDQAVLAEAARTARRQGVCAVQTLIADGWLSASAYYRALAEHIGVAFDDTWPELDCGSDVASTLRSGRVEVHGRGTRHWLHAPQGSELRALLSGHLSYLDPTKVAITTPAHLAALVHFRAQETIEDIATQWLPRERPQYSAKSALDAWTWSVIALVAVYLGACVFLFPRATSDLFGVLFLASIVFRVGAAAEGFFARNAAAARLSDAELPRYTVLVPLHDEAEVVCDLIAALTSLDYPRAKLEVLLLIEPEDHATRAALATLALPPWLHVVFAPQTAHLRTKPRALNIGLMMATGDLLTVYDAEDRPDPNQLRLAAAAFVARPELACLQARLAIDNGGRSLLARMFAIEYATLFDVLNVGITSLGLPLALGGTSNHFRCAALRQAGGWDAWNVTEDADLGLRLARLGYRVGDLASTTMEAAPEKMSVWIKQRRRWMKGWMQTLAVLAHDAPSAIRDLGLLRSTALALLLFGMVFGPLCLPVFSGLVAYRLMTHGVSSPQGIVELLEATLTTFVPILGVAWTFGAAFVGMMTRGLKRFLPSLPLILPYQLMISLATFAALGDLIFRPYHWHKTPHGRHTPEIETSAPVRARRSASQSSH